MEYKDKIVYYNIIKFSEYIYALTYFRAKHQRTQS